MVNSLDKKMVEALKELKGAGCKYIYCKEMPNGQLMLVGCREEPRLIGTKPYSKSFMVATDKLFINRDELPETLSVNGKGTYWEVEKLLNPTVYRYQVTYKYKGRDLSSFPIEFTHIVKDEYEKQRLFEKLWDNFKEDLSIQFKKLFEEE